MHDGYCCSGYLCSVSLTPADGRALARVLPHCAQLKAVDISGTHMVWLVGCLVAWLVVVACVHVSGCSVCTNPSAASPRIRCVLVADAHLVVMHVGPHAVDDVCVVSCVLAVRRERHAGH